MMTRMSAVGPEALSRRDRISSGISTMIREGSTKMGSANTAMRDKLLGISVSPPTIGSSPLSADPDMELKEEDILGMDEFPVAPHSSSSEENLQLLDDPQPRVIRRLHWLGDNRLNAVMNSLILLMGLATLSSPYAIAQSGWIGILACLGVAFFYWHATNLLFKCMELTDADSYMGIARIAFSQWGHKIVTFLFYMETFGTLVGFFISIGDMATRALPQLKHIRFSRFHGRDIAILSAFVMILPMTWQRLSVMSVFSFVCNAALVIVIGCVLSIGAKSVGFNHSISFVSLPGALEAFGIFSFAFGATPVFPSIFASTGKSKSFKKVLVGSFGIATGIYIFVGVAGAVMFGHTTKSLITTNLPPSLTSTVANWIGILIPISKFPILAAPVLIDMEKWKLVEDRWFHKIILRSTVIFSVLLIAIFVPHFSTVIELVGSSLTIALCTVIPTIFYLRLSSPSLREKVFMYSILILYVVIGISGTVRSILIFAKR